MGLTSKRQEEVDRISELPNSLLCHILLFLPILDAVQTTILSRRWENLWTSLPKLEFEDDCFPFSWIRSNRFMMFVDRVLSLHDSTDIQKFSFKLFSHMQICIEGTWEHFTLIYNWICIVVRHNVVELDLDLMIFDNDSFKLPQCLFLCKTLEVLKVSSRIATYAPPTSGCFPSLKVLTVNVEDLDDSVAKLFSHCPVLEYLYVGVTSYVDASYVNISAPRLKTLTIWLDDDFRRNEAADDDLRFYINAPNLEKLRLMSDVFYSSIDLENAKSLVEANVLFRTIYTPHIADRATKFLAGISNVRYLSLTVPILEASYLPTFENLIQLKLVLHDGNYWEFLTGFLKNSPVLKHLVFQNNGNDWSYSGNEDEWNLGNPQTLCLFACRTTSRPSPLWDSLVSGTKRKLLSIC